MECAIEIEVCGMSRSSGEADIVEVKGQGHPDSVADAVSEALQAAIAGGGPAANELRPYAYTDKTLIVCGTSKPEWGAGEIQLPCRVVSPLVLGPGAGGGPWDDVARAAIAARVPRYPTELIEVDIPLRRAGAHSWLTYSGDAEAEDSCVSVAHAPQGDLERAAQVVIEVVNYSRLSIPAIGPDNKWMLYRRNGITQVVGAVAFVCGELGGIAAYLEAKDAVERAVETELAAIVGGVDVRINPDDRPKLGTVYTTVTGSSIEGGDCGVTGRGNRQGGCITPLRPMTLEAHAGKPGSSHPSRFGAFLAGWVAEALVRVDGVRRAEVAVVAHVGQAVQEPEAVMARVFVSRRAGRRAYEEEIRSAMDQARSTWLE